MKKDRLIIASNRLPFTITQMGKDLKLRPSVGGLSTGLKAFLENTCSINKFDYLWIGNSELAIEQGTPAALKMKLHKCNPICGLRSSDAAMSQNFFNQTIWPLFHGFIDAAVYVEKHWQAYKKVNIAFCEEILKNIQSQDSVWIHDYQLMLLPSMLRKVLPNLTIGFFLHIPFPPWETLQFLPENVRREILDGMVGANLLGFHIKEYQEHFLRSFFYTTGFGAQDGVVSLTDRAVKTHSYPMSIDYSFFRNISENISLELEEKKIIDKLERTKVILSVDRLDYTKGIDRRIAAYEIFLYLYPQWRRKVIMVLIVAPSRQNLPLYKELLQSIGEKVNSVNERFGDKFWCPIFYRYNFFEQKFLAKLYNIGEVGLITPLKDGMNLTAKEYVAAQKNGDGVLILSETAGAARELLGAIIVNPYCVENVADAIKQALEMPIKEKRRRLNSMQERLRSWDVFNWGNAFFNDLKDTNHDTNRQLPSPLSIKMQQLFKQKLLASEKNLFLLDYDGTLTGFRKNPRDAYPTDELKKLLISLGENTQNRVVIISGRESCNLEEWFGNYPIELAAEHGALFKEHGLWKELMPLNNSWKEHLKTSFDYFAEKLPGAFVEEKKYSIVWHYRNTDLKKRNKVIADLHKHLEMQIKTFGIVLMKGHGVIEVKSVGQGKNVAVSHILQHTNYDFILAIGDDTTDEDMFKVLPSNAISVKVGHNKNTQALFFLSHHKDVLFLLKELNEAQNAYSL